MKALQLLTDQNHYMSKVEIFPALYVSRANTLHISEQSVTGFKGFGVAITGASCYELSLMESEERQKLLEKIYTKKGLGLSVGRLSIGASDYSAEIYSYDDVSFDKELKHFSIGRDEKYIIPIIKQILKINPELHLFASPWSPPGWMKTGGNMCGGYMREEFVKILKEKFLANGIDTKIWIYDHNFADTDRVLWQLDNTEGLKEAIDGVAFHYYEGTIEETLKLKETYPELPLHFSEAGPRLYDNYDVDWCKWGTMVAKALQCGFSSFTGWNLMLNETGGPNIGPFLCGGLITRNNDTGELNYSGQYKAFEHIAKYINDESKISPICVGREYDMPMYSYPKENRKIEGFCIENKDEKILVLINPNDTKRQTQIFLNDTWWYMELTPESISTVFIG